MSDGRVNVQTDIAGVEPQTKIDFDRALKNRTPPLVNFRETKHSVLVHDFRVFIQGVDVTPWVRESVSVTYANRDGYNTASFSLDNAFDRFVLTEENLGLKKVPEGASHKSGLIRPTFNPSADETVSERTLRQYNEEPRPISERASGEVNDEDNTFLPPRFRLNDPYGPNWRYSEAAKYEVFLYKSGITKKIRRDAEKEVEKAYVETIPKYIPQIEDKERDLLEIARDVVRDTLNRISSATKNKRSLTDDNGKLTPRGIAVRDFIAEKLKEGDFITEAPAFAFLEEDTYQANISEGNAVRIANEEIARRVERDEEARIVARDSGLSQNEAEAIAAFRDRELQQVTGQNIPVSGITEEELENKSAEDVMDVFTSSLDSLGFPEEAQEILRQFSVDDALNILRRIKNRVSGVRNVRDPDTGRSVWPLVPKATIIHKNDPVRIFLKNPHNELDEWIFAFTGFVDQVDKSVEYTAGESSLSVSCYDIRSLMQKMRVSFSVHDAKLVRQEPLFLDRSNYFSDLLLPARYGHAFFGRTMEETVTALITGKTLSAEADDELGDTLDEDLNVAGIGQFKRGNTIEYPNTESQDPEHRINRKVLELWHTQAFTNKPDASFLTLAEVNAIGSETTTDGRFAPDVSNLHFLLPQGGTGVRDLVQGTFETGTSERDWTERYSVITEFLSRLNYEWTVLPTGDIAVEFPMMDFLPQDFGGYDPIMRADLQLISGRVTDEQGDITTALVVTGSAAPISNVGNPSNSGGDEVMLEHSDIIPRVLVQPSVLAARVGMRVETVSMPHITDPARLHAMALVEFEKQLSDVAQLETSFGYRPFLVPNRPILNTEELRLGTASSITQNLSIFAEASTESALKYVRTMEMDGTFRHVTGGASMPISYRQVSSSEDLEQAREAFGSNTRTSGVRVASPIDRGALEDQDVEQDDPEPAETPDPPNSRPQRPEPQTDKQTPKNGRSSPHSDDRFVFRLTRYDIAHEDDGYPFPSDFESIPILDVSGDTISEVSPAFFCDLMLQGSARLSDGRLVGIASRDRAISVNPDAWRKHIEDMRAVRRSGLCVSGGNLRGVQVKPNGEVVVRSFVVRPEGEEGFGHGVSQDHPIIPFRTVAADLGRLSRSEPVWEGNGGLVPLGSRVYIEAFDGLDDPYTGNKHDGYFTVTDTGGAIFGAHLDIFTGTRELGETLHPPLHAVVEYAGIDQRFAAAEDRVGAIPDSGTYYGYGLKNDPNFELRQGSNT